MRVIGLDLGTSCGYAWTDDGTVRATQSGVWDLKPRRHEGGGMRFLRFEKMLGDIMLGCHSDDSAVFYEEVRGHRGTDAAHVYGGLLAIVQRMCEARGIPYRGIPVGTIKKRATGKGNASKGLMIQAAVSEFVCNALANDYVGASDLLDDNQADACWVLQCGLEELGLGPDENA